MRLIDHTVPALIALITCAVFKQFDNSRDDP